jgi:hypothetical protein
VDVGQDEIWIVVAGSGKPEAGLGASLSGMVRTMSAWLYRATW